MLLYFESVFAEPRRCVTTIPDATSPTLNTLVMTAMRAHTRPGPFLEHIGNQWKPTPDWRFDRRVIRMGLYLREFVGVEAGDRVAIVSEARAEWLVADLAIAGLGAVSVAICPTMDPLLLSGLLADTAPKAVFVSDRALPTVEVVALRISSIRAIVSWPRCLRGPLGAAATGCLDSGPSAVFDAVGSVPRHLIVAGRARRSACLTQLGRSSRWQSYIQLQ